MHGSRPKAKKATRVSIAEVKDDLSRDLRLAEKEEVVITRHGQPAGVLIGFESEDDWFEYRLQRDPMFLASQRPVQRFGAVPRGLLPASRGRTPRSLRPPSA